MFYEVKCTNKDCKRFKVSRLVKDDEAAEPCPRCDEEMTVVSAYGTKSPAAQPAQETVA